MGYSTSAGRTLHRLVRMVIPLCQQAARAFPRTGPGRPPEIPDWVLLVLVTIALLKHRHNKSAQYRFLSQHRTEIMRWIGTRRFPSRSTYCDRYRRAIGCSRWPFACRDGLCYAAAWAMPAVSWSTRVWCALWDRPGRNGNGNQERLRRE